MDIDQQYATEMLWVVAVADLPVEPTAEHQSSFENIDPNVLTLCLVKRCETVKPIWSLLRLGYRFSSEWNKVCKQSITESFNLIHLFHDFGFLQTFCNNKCSVHLDFSSHPCNSFHLPHLFDHPVFIVVGRLQMGINAAGSVACVASSISSHRNATELKSS